MDIFFEICRYLSVRKKFWLAPVMITLFIVGYVLFISSGTFIAPFIYTLF